MDSKSITRRERRRTRNGRRRKQQSNRMHEKEKQEKGKATIKHLARENGLGESK
jgi:hypothetical protein